MKEKKTIVFLGAGRLISLMAKDYAKGLMPAYEVIGVLGRSEERAAEVAEICGCGAVKTIDEAVALQPDYIVEAASVTAVKNNLMKILTAGINFVPLSIGAFADEAFLEEAKRKAEETGAVIYFPGGAIGGYDILQAISRMEDVSMEFTFIKDQGKLSKTDLGPLCPPDKVARVYEDVASEAIKVLPGGVNVSVAAALATIGPDKMKVTIDSDPFDATERIGMHIKAKDATADILIACNPAELVYKSVVAFLNNLASPIRFS